MCSVSLLRILDLARLSRGVRSYYRVGVVGSGPAGFYTAQRILKLNSGVKVDIIERLPAPFGLVSVIGGPLLEMLGTTVVFCEFCRYGVSPDHPEVKNVITQFTNLLRDPRCKFYGNVSVGTDITLDQLLSNYSAVVLAYGADADRRLGVPGEESQGFLSARRFVGWYNGLPEDAGFAVDLSSHTAVIIGHGNVAIDIARILLSPVELLNNTDMCTHAIAALRESAVKRVILVGRRGPLQVAFTIKELRELLRLKQTAALLKREDHDFLAPIIPTLPRGRKRLIELLYKTSQESSDALASNRQLEIRYLHSPVRINSNTEGKVTSITFELNTLEDPSSLQSVAVGTGAFVSIECGIAFRSIGYKSVPILEGVPFDNTKHIIPNVRGGVAYLDGTLFRGMYCSGWIKRGPVGVIASTMNDAFETAETIQEDITKGQLQEFSTEFNLCGLLPDEHRVVQYKDWSNLDSEEVSRGGESKPREKIVSIQEMIDLITTKTH